MRNVEIKARCADPDRARRRAMDLGARHGGLLHQVDTYYRVPDGRLKLREADTAELIFYRRADLSGPKGSDYLVAPVVMPGAMNDLLSQALGAWARVEKTRELYLLDNVRIHLDEVAGLGHFIEFEAVVDSDHDEVDCEASVHRLLREFEIEPNDLLKRSYSDLIGSAGV